jgi:acetylglutamate kinase
MESIKQKTKVLIEALPYIKKFHNKIVVIKYGGSAMDDERLKNSVIKDITFLKYAGLNPVIVHGGGNQISEEMKKKNLKPRFISGLRVTDEKTIEIVEKILFRINKELVNLIEKEGLKPKTLLGNKNLIFVKQKDKNLGYVGEVKKIDSKLLKNIIKKDFIPIISSLGTVNKKTYNINADSAATSIAVALKAEKLTILTDVDGVIEKNQLVSHLSLKQAIKYIKKGIITKGMIPKVKACIYAVKNGCNKAHLINGKTKHSLLLEIFTDKGVGTEIVMNNKK